VTRTGASHRRRLPRQYVTFAFTERVVEVGVDPSVGSVGDAYNNALAESQIGLYKTEVTRPEGPWRGVEHVELETLNSVDWFNTREAARGAFRSNSDGSRRTSLRCQERAHADRLSQEKESPETPGRFSHTPAARCEALQPDRPLALRSLRR
jgi:transposase InsO family protein